MHSIPMGDRDGDPEGDLESFDAPDDADYSPPLSAEIPLDFAGLRFDQALARLFPQHSRSRLQNWIRDGLVSLDGVPADTKQKIWGGESVEVRPVADPSAAQFEAEAIPLAVVYEDAQILVIDKPAGLVVHPGSGNWSGTLLNALLHHCPESRTLPRAGIVHRLDKDTSGLLVVAKTAEAQTDLVRQLQARTVKRDYCALVHGVPVPAQGIVDAPIGRHRTERTRMAIDERGRPARTHYRTVENFEAASLLECSLESGRTHQIRVHMQSIGFPLVGDPVYGKRQGRSEVLNAFKRQALHAARLGLIHPHGGEALSWEAPLPADFTALLEELRA